MTFEHIGRYQVKGEIGRGGMATVYHANDPRFERDVAIKVLPAEFMHDPQFRARFEREAKMIALLEHPAIVPVYDFGEENGQPFIVMRYMSGGSLSDRLKQGPLPLTEAWQIVARLASSLDAAHAKGIIHRDLKPGNILFDQYGNAFLSDFGIARLTQSGQSATLTGGAILGTPSYMSPEQIQGDKEIDGRSDIYALGVILYQMLTGATPYKADTPAKIMMMHILEPVPDIRAANPSLPAGIEAIIQKAMAKEPAERYATAAEMVAELEVIVKGQGEATSPKLDAALMASRAQKTVMAPGRLKTSEHPPLRGKATEILPEAPPPAPPLAKAKTGFPLWLGVLIGLLAVGVVAALAVGGIGYFSGAFNRPTATPPAPTATLPVVVVNLSSTPTPPPTSTPTPNPTPTPPPPLTPSPTPVPSATNTPTATSLPQIPIVGGADRLALLDGNNNLWVMNVDGSQPIQLTVDNAAKENLQWSPDGQYVIFISGNCVKMVNVETGRLDDLTCFVSSYPNSLKAFEISPNGQQVAISFIGELYILPYKLDVLKSVDRISKLKANATCEKVAPYSSANGTAIIVKWVRWSQDMKSLAVNALGVFEGKQVDQIDILDIANCDTSVYRVDEFPATRFSMSGYKDNPRIENFAWNGEALFVLTGGTMRNTAQGGFGDLYLYDSTLHRGQKINPINGRCCYRDPQWSPDGNYLAFAYQDIQLGPASVTQIYLVQYGMIATGAGFEPLALPPGFFSNSKDRPQPVLRPAK